jgi:hypothetical protein
MRLLPWPGKARFFGSLQSLRIAVGYFMTLQRDRFQKISHRRDEIFPCLHICVRARDFCRLPDFCGELATEFARCLTQRRTKESSSEAL